MILLLLAAAGVAWWYWGRHLSRPQLIAAASALAGAFLALRGAWAVAIPLFLPGIWLQAITTKQPDDSMIEVAICSMQEATPVAECVQWL